MKFFNTQTIAVTVFLLMYCAAGKSLYDCLLLIRESSIASGVLSGGVTYTRWGHTACPIVTDEDGASVTEITEIYTGRMAGGYYTTHGGGANYLCLPNDPDYIPAGTQRSRYESKIYGTEYRFPVAGSAGHNVPCAVCHATTRTAK